jgi:hypothetical protein
MSAGTRENRSWWLERVFGEAMREFKYHTNPAHHPPIHVAPIHHPVKRTLVVFAGLGMLGLAGVGAITPIMPTWPFALVALFCFARSSSRVRNWVTNNHVIKSVMSLVRSRPERPFAWARQCLDWLIGGQTGLR